MICVRPASGWPTLHVHLGHHDIIEHGRGCFYQLARWGGSGEHEDVGDAKTIQK